MNECETCCYWNNEYQENSGFVAIDWRTVDEQYHCGVCTLTDKETTPFHQCASWRQFDES